MDIETVFLALRVVVALGAVFGALFVAHRWITKGRPGAASRNRAIQVVARQGLGAKAGIAVVDAEGRRYLLGVTEHAVTVLDTLGPADPDLDVPASRAAGSTTVTRFEQELRTVTIATTDLPVLVQGAPPADPAPRAGDPLRGPEVRIEDLALLHDAARRADPVPASRRQLRAAEQRRAAERAGPLAGSVLSPATWRQTVDALRRPR